VTIAAFGCALALACAERSEASSLVNSTSTSTERAFEVTPRPLAYHIELARVKADLNVLSFR